MNEPAQRCEEQIISLFQDRETLVCRGWILKKMGGHLCVYPLYYKYSQGNIPDNIRKMSEIYVLEESCRIACFSKTAQEGKMQSMLWQMQV